MTWLEIGLLWIVLSVAVPVLLGLRYTQLKEYRQRLARARIHFHRFHVGHRLPRLVR
ncbi:MAG: hypothetical protein JWO51_4102 [Rhodospirillales bacterium]|nr:hypothetical protein [Rhodospirillales bacterium]